MRTMCLRLLTPISFGGNDPFLAKLESKMSFPSKSGNEQDHRSDRIVHRRVRSKIREKQQ
jgi:hypothetical protein